MRRLAWTLPLIVSLAASPAALAQDAKGEAIAETLFRKAKDLMKAGKIHEACEKLAASYQLDPTLGTLLNLAVCHDKEGLTASAWTEYSEAAAKASRAGQKDRESFARAQAKTLEPKLLYVTIKVLEAVDGITVTLDGHRLVSASWDTSLAVDPGEHKVEATAPGRKGWAQSFSASPEKPSYVVQVPVLEVVAAASLPAEELTPPVKQETVAPTIGSGRRWQRIAAWSLAGLAVVLGGVAVAEQVHKNQLQSDISALAGPNGAIAQENLQKYHSLESDITSATRLRSGFAMGAIAAAAGSGTFFVLSLWPSRPVAGSRAQTGFAIAIGGRF